jgi:hypothetical protein
MSTVAIMEGGPMGPAPGCLLPLVRIRIRFAEQAGT